MSTTLPLIYNPTAGGGCERKCRSAFRELERLGVEVKPLPTSGPGSATGLAARAAGEGARRIIVAGGDGTINEAINGFTVGETELAVIPAGTANVLAIELGVPFNVKEACRIAARGEATRMDLGLAGERRFALMAGVGFDAMAIKNLNPVLKKTIRHAAYPISGIKTMLREKLPLLHVSDGERESEGYFVVVANSRFYGGRFGPTPEASITDGLLDICVLKEKSFPGMLNFWVHALAKATLDKSGAEYFRSAGLEVSCPGGERVPVQTDGDLIGELPMKFSVLPGALKVCRGKI